MKALVAALSIPVVVVRMSLRGYHRRSPVVDGVRLRPV
jgi:hypothetical protein